ncbi:MAG: hypothetical protein H9W81_13405 [Enterococcus sp.]|nr:hypothetical protein [Enterococcus sp.]
MITVTDAQRIYITHIADEKRCYVTENDGDDNLVALKILQANRRDFANTLTEHGDKMTSLQRSTLNNVQNLLLISTPSALEAKVVDLLGFDHPAALWHLERMGMMVRDHMDWFNGRTKPLYSVI